MLANQERFIKHSKKNMAVKFDSAEKDEVTEIDLTSENIEVLSLFNGNLKFIQPTMHLKFEERKFCNIDAEDLVSKCSNTMSKAHKQDLTEQIKQLNLSILKSKDAVRKTNMLSQRLACIHNETKSLFKIPIISSKMYIKSGVVNEVQPPAIKSVTCKEPVVSEGVEILNTANDGIKQACKEPVASEGLEILTVNDSLKDNLPPIGELKRRPIELGSRVWAMKTNLINLWVKGVVINIKTGSNKEKIYKVRLDNVRHINSKKLSAKHLAYETNASVIIPVGTRIIARYTDSGGQFAHYAGIVAEPPKSTNCNRYLIFFDDGCPQYVKHEDTYVVCAQSVDVADDVNNEVSEFVRNYLLQYPERPMVRLQVNQYVKVEYLEEWNDAKVLEVDASMVKMLFLKSNRIEWIYRGSTRLKLLQNELANAEAHRLEGKNRRRHNIPRRPHQPYIEYTREDVVVLDSDSDDDKNPVLTEEIKPIRTKNTARKSLATRPLTTLNVIANPVYRVADKKSHQGYKVPDTSVMKSFRRVTYHDHQCDNYCGANDDPAKYKGRNPYLIPILLGWERQLRKYRACGPGPKQVVTYRSSCGRHFRNLRDIHCFLLLVKSKLTIDLFSFDCNINIFKYFRPKRALYKVNDITKGKENVPISCVNSLSNEPPPYVEYSAERYAGEGVFLNLDEDFLCGCDCTDNCQNPATCLCQQHTNYARYGKIVGKTTYKFRRLREPVVTGIYECNSRCKCNFQCGNRVVQNGLMIRLQMFKTQYKGWGIRCLDDVDAGQFICVYAGQLLTEQGADEDGKECGDEYLAELDHIEVVEKTKEGYESDVPEFLMDYDNDDSSIKKDDNNDNLSSDDQDAASSDSDIQNSNSDSEFEPRSTATSTYASRRRQRNGRKHTNLSDSYFISDDSSSCAGESDKYHKSLPDIETNLANIFKINPRPPSPESAEALEKIELKRKPKISNDGGLLKLVAKKSVSMPKPLSSLQFNHRENKFKSVRSFFGEDSLYIMDAKTKGNIGRYLNHSCEPNVFVQNVFVDTHDLRFPAVAFFAIKSINAGTELTWDYNYEVGSVADKVMYCYCENPSCRGRLL